MSKQMIQVMALLAIGIVIALLATPKTKKVAANKVIMTREARWAELAKENK